MTNPLLAAIDRAVDIEVKALDRALGMVIESAMDEGHLRKITGVRSPDELTEEQFLSLKTIFHKDDEQFLCPFCLWIKQNAERKAKRGGL